MSPGRARSRTRGSRHLRTSGGGSFLGRLFFFATAFALGLVLGVGGPWVWWLDREASARFAERQWTQAGRVYARPLELYPGLAISADDLEFELRATGLGEGDPASPGRYRRSGSRFELHLPAFHFADGLQDSVAIEVTVAAHRVQALRAAGDSMPALVRVPPAELGSLLPLDERDRTLIALADFPPLLVAGVQAVEDRQFRHHHGVDPRALTRAAWRNLRERGVVEGGSTITQQLVKNLYLTPDRSLARKLNEAVMAVSLEARFSKGEILEAYLNDVYLGQMGNQAIHGFGRASEHYFGLPVQALAPEQIALLIGMVRGASWYHPVRNPERALARRNLVLEVFGETGLLTAGEVEQARGRPLGTSGRTLASRRASPAFMDLVRRQLRADYRDRDLREQGLRIFTTLSPSAQNHAEQALAAALPQVERRAGELQGAVVLVQPDSGEVRALVGDRETARVGFNRALDARRPVGSVIKPFVYLLALADPGRFHLATPVLDAPMRIPRPGREDWIPRNYEGTSHGRVPLMTALAQSYNQATVRVGMEVGVDPLFRLMEQLGVDPGQARHPAAFLGAVDLTPYQVAQLYQAIAAEGYSTPLRAINDVVDSRGRSVGRYPVRLRPIRERHALALLDFALQEAVASGTGQSLGWRLSSASVREASVRGKTGTTNDRRDAWFAGYTGQWLGVVWVGRDDHQPAGVEGSRSALPVWAELFNRLPHERRGRAWPEGLDWFWIDWPEPLLADENCNGARALPFAPGTPVLDRSPCLGPDEDRRWFRQRN